MFPGCDPYWPKTNAHHTHEYAMAGSPTSHLSPDSLHAPLVTHLVTQLVVVCVTARKVGWGSCKFRHNLWCLTLRHAKYDTTGVSHHKLWARTPLVSVIEPNGSGRANFDTTCGGLRCGTQNTTRPEFHTTSCGLELRSCRFLNEWGGGRANFDTTCGTEEPTVSVYIVFG